MPSDISPTEQQNAAELAATRQASLKDRTRQQFKKMRVQRIQASPPNFAVYSLIGLVAFTNDIVDYATVVFTITGFWLIVLKVIDIGTGIILVTWAFMSGVERTTKSKKAKNRIWRFVFAWVIEMIPILGELSPTWTIAVFLAWREHRKAYQQSFTQRQKERQARQQEQAQAQLEGKYAQQMETQHAPQEVA